MNGNCKHKVSYLQPEVKMSGIVCEGFIAASPLEKVSVNKTEVDQVTVKDLEIIIGDEKVWP